MPVALIACWLAAGAARAAETIKPECPKGLTLIETGNPYTPLECVGKGARRGARDVVIRPRCPHGTKPVVNIRGQQPTRCVPEPQVSPEPHLTRVAEGRGRAATWEAPRDNAPEGRFFKGAERAPAPLSDRSFIRYVIGGDVAFEAPRAWRLNDAWQGEVPAIDVVFDPGIGGKQVILGVTMALRSQPGYQEMGLAILKELEWQGAVELSRVKVDGVSARVLEVQDKSRNAYVSSGKSRYFVLNYSAPRQLYKIYLPAFERLLKTFRVESAEPGESGS